MMFISQDVIVGKMTALLAQSASWTDEEWFLGPFSLQVRFA